MKVVAAVLVAMWCGLHACAGVWWQCTGVRVCAQGDGEDEEVRRMEGGMQGWAGGMGGMCVGVEHHGICAMQTYSQWGSNPRPMAHKTITLTTELREP